MLRYLRRLADRDYALDRGDDPARLVHDEAQRHDRDGADHATRASPTSTRSRRRAVRRLPRSCSPTCERWLAEITGYDAVSLQPNAGSQGEFAGLLAIRNYHRANGESDRDVCLIPAQRPRHERGERGDGRHARRGRRDRRRAGRDRPRRPAREDRAARRRRWPRSWSPTRRPTACSRTTSARCARWSTTPAARSTSTARTSTRWSALARPGHFGADVSHLNLHKTFCIPHGGGGPGRRARSVSGHTSRRTCPTTRCSRRRPGRPAAEPSPRRRGARRRSCRSPGPTSG